MTLFRWTLRGLGTALIVVACYRTRYVPHGTLIIFCAALGGAAWMLSEDAR